MIQAQFDPRSLFQIGYGLYVLTTRDGEKDNGCIVNTVMQITSSPCLVAVTVSRANYSCAIVSRTGKLNINCLTKDTPFSIFSRFGFQSGRDTDKFDSFEKDRSWNGLVVLKEHVSAFISLSVEREIDLGSHIMFICTPVEGRVISDEETVSYTYYQKNIKPSPENTEKKKGFICEICGYIYEGETLPDDYICPWCQHGKEVFRPL